MTRRRVVGGGKRGGGGRGGGGSDRCKYAKHIHEINKIV